MSKTKLRSFGLRLGCTFFVIGLVTAIKRGLGPISFTSGILGVSLALAGSLVPKSLGLVHAGWTKFASQTSRITTPILMALIYFLILTPTGLLMRLAGKRPLPRRTGHTAWVVRPAGSRQGTLERQF